MTHFVWDVCGTNEVSFHKYPQIKKLYFIKDIFLMLIIVIYATKEVSMETDN